MAGRHKNGFNDTGIADEAADNLIGSIGKELPKYESCQGIERIIFHSGKGIAKYKIENQ